MNALFVDGFFFSLALFGCKLYVTSDFKRFAYRQIYLLHTQFVFGLGRFKIAENFVLLHDQLRAELRFDWRIGNTILGALWLYVLSSAPQRLFNRLLSIKFILLLPSNVLVATLDQLSFASKLPVFYYNFNLPLTAKNRPWTTQVATVVIASHKIGYKLLQRKLEFPKIRVSLIFITRSSLLTVWKFSKNCFLSYLKFLSEANPWTHEKSIGSPGKPFCWLRSPKISNRAIVRFWTRLQFFYTDKKAV